MKVGDKFVATKNVLGFLNEGDTVVVSNVGDNGMVYFIFSLNNFEGKGHMTPNEFSEHFRKVEVEKAIDNTVSELVPYEFVEALMEESEIEFMTVGNCTVVTCTLPNGFVIVDSSACVNSEDYDEEIGVDICLNKIADKIWQYETYRVMYEGYIRTINECNCDVCEEDCDGCLFEGELNDENMADDADCNGCEEFDCPDHPYRKMSSGIKH